MSFKEVKEKLTNYFGRKVRDVFYLCSSEGFDYYLVYFSKKLSGVVVLNKEGVVLGFYE